MIFETSRSNALKNLEDFIDNEISHYGQRRNFDYGPKKRNNVSCLSPYVTHRIITEYEIIEKVLKKFPFQKVEKYIQEIFWRVYWKGWLELRPQVWTDFIEDLKKIEEDSNYHKAVNGETQIQCFNDWIKELRENNYLHNHTRMWFASIWIFTLGLPWQKGAEFFMKYLFDGDAASNTLSWRWVAGLQTKGKHYIAQAWNINKFTDNRYKDVKLNEKAMPLTDKREYKPKYFRIEKNINYNKNLILFENDLSIESLKLQSYEKIFSIILSNKSRKIKIDEKVLNYKKNLMTDQIKRVEKINIINEEALDKLCNSLESFDVIYPCVGENLSYLKNLKMKNNLNFNFINRDLDNFCWQFSNKGYFNFKSNIPKILQKLNLSL